ncbi:TAXI family TRAP transporter solute-binding subunit [Phytohabitans sp. LJ34]|uniref:TAXI family TRAP transporter solute-binding subunit n=1 Tax=Phytohabitans sp. LJ34 TaxID=3452217 RepID=UPI003F89F791
MRGRRATTLLLLAALTTACDGGDAGPERLVIAGGGAGDVYNALAHALADAARDEVTGEVRVLPTEGSIDNLRAVAEGQADVGFATVDATSQAAQGEGPFSGALPIVALARLYDDYLHIVVRADSKVRQLRDLAGLDISTGPPGSGTHTIASRVVQEAGHDINTFQEHHLTLARSTEALATRDIAGLFVTGGLPMPALVDMSKHTPFRLLTLSDQIDRLQARYGEIYQARTIPATRTYAIPASVKQPDPVDTLGVTNVLVVRRALPEKTAYRLTELLFAAKPRLVAAHEEARRLDHRSALATYPVQLHPGAATYYRDHKIMAGSP